MRRLRRTGQASTEQVILISVLVIAIVGAANSAFIPMFQSGVEDLGNDVEEILISGAIGGAGAGSRSPGASSPGAGNRGNGNGNGRRNGNGRATDPGNRNGMPFELGPPSPGDSP